MGEKTAIPWCDHTFNCWRGCCKVATGCLNCYATRLSVRQPDKFGTWGPDGKRVVAAESTWKQPLAWNRKAEREGVRKRVFCGSLMDFFEDRRDLDDPRHRASLLMWNTPWLDWLVLTKRPEKVRLLWPEWRMDAKSVDMIWPRNVWLGTSASTQAELMANMAELCRVHPTIRFLSLEPLAEPVSILEAHWPNWVIVGCESGPKRRPMRIEWVEQIVNECCANNIPVFVKQLEINGRVSTNMHEWPGPIRLRQFPET